MSDYRYLILGGGTAAGFAAQSLAEEGLAPGELCIVSRETTAPYHRPPLSKDYLAGEKTVADTLVNPPDFYDEHGITLRLDTELIGVDFDKREAKLADGERIAYEKLLIVTGARPRPLDVPGAQHDDVLYLRHLPDSDAILRRAKSARRCAIIGGGYIGMEVASQLADKGIEVTLIGNKPHLMDRLFTDEMGTFFDGYYRERGVRLILDAEVTAVIVDGQPQAVDLASGERVETDMVVVGVGIDHNTQPFENTALEIDDGSIVVDEYLQTNLDGVYAAGDVAKWLCRWLGERLQIEHWDNAVHQGKHAGRALAGRREVYDRLPYFFSDVFDLSWEYWGWKKEGDDVVLRGEPSADGFSVWWLDGDRVVAAFVLAGAQDYGDRPKQWVRERRRVNRERLADPATELDDALQA